MKDEEHKKILTAWEKRQEDTRIEAEEIARYEIEAAEWKERAEAAEAKLAAAIETAAAAAILSGQWEEKARRWGNERDSAIARAEVVEAALAAVPFDDIRSAMMELRDRLAAQRKSGTTEGKS